MIKTPVKGVQLTEVLMNRIFEPLYFFLKNIRHIRHSKISSFGDLRKGILIDSETKILTGNRVEKEYSFGGWVLSHLVRDAFV